MRRPLLAAAVPLSLLALACGHAQPVPARAAVPETAVPAAPEPVLPSASAPQRQVGDFFVHRFSGSFAREPLTLSEEVKAREPGAWVVDFSLTENEKVEQLRVRFDVQSGRPVSAARLLDGSETKATLADYEALVARTVYAADVNDGLVSSTAQTCLVGSDELECETKTYNVWIGERAATLSVTHSATFADRDVAGEITTEDGKLVYRAELLEARQGKPSRGFASR